MVVAYGISIVKLWLIVIKVCILKINFKNVGEKCPVGMMKSSNRVEQSWCKYFGHCILNGKCEIRLTVVVYRVAYIKKEVTSKVGVSPIVISYG